jgi:hypothetical protein
MFVVTFNDMEKLQCVFLRYCKNPSARLPGRSICGCGPRGHFPPAVDQLTLVQNRPRRRLQQTTMSITKLVYL